MSKTSTAAVLEAQEALTMQSFPVPEVGADDAVLRVEVTGVCSSDAAAFSRGPDIHDLPCVLGHEMVGRIESIGEDASARWQVKQGDRVAVEEYLPCGTCEACLAGVYQMCASTRYGTKSIADYPSLWGGYSEYLYLHPRTLLHKVDPAVPLEVTQLHVPISNGIFWTQEAGGMSYGDTVVVQGPGPHGLGCVIGAREGGAGCIVVVGLSRDERRLEVARELGADHVVMADREDPVAVLREITDGRLADVVVNLATSPHAFPAALDLARPRGTVLQLGFGQGFADAMRPDVIVYKALTIRGIWGRPSRMVGPALDLMASGSYPLEKICTHRFGLDDVEAALRTVADGSADVVRAFVMPD